MQKAPSEAVAQRIGELNGYLEIPDFEVDAVNIEAVKAAYLDGSLEIRPGYWTYWAGGHQKTDYINNISTLLPDPSGTYLRWVREENGIRVWKESPGRAIPEHPPNAVYFHGRWLVPWDHKDMPCR